MLKHIRGIPDYFTRDQYMALFDAVGLEPANVSELAFRSDGVYARVMERTDEGRVTHANGDPVVHRVFIPVRDDEDDDSTTTIDPVDPGGTVDLVEK